MRTDLGDERRTIAELEMRYRLEPALGDVFVEGPSDERIISWFLEHHQRTSWRVYPIDTVRVDADLVRRNGLDVGERGEVITLGIELSRLLNDFEGRKPVCIADSDYDVLDESLSVGCQLCLFTDYASMEIYAFCEKPMSKFLAVFIQTKRTTISEVIGGLTPTLVTIYVVRAVLKKMSPEIGLVPSFTRYLERKPEGVQVDLRGLVTASINSASQGIFRPNIEDCINEVHLVHSRLPVDLRRVIRGHDLVAGLAWFLSIHGVPTEIRHRHVITRALMTSIEIDELGDYTMFSELLYRTLP